MAGHSKWSNIQHRKKAQDAKRGKQFTKLIREIVVAAREGGADRSANSSLRLAIDKAFQANMSKDTVQKAIDRGAGNTDADNYQSITYEGYGPGGIAVLVKCLSDNRNRTVSEVRHAFSKYQGNLGTEGSVAFLFKKCGYIVIECDAATFDQLFDQCAELDIEDIDYDTVATICTSVNQFESVYETLKTSQYHFLEATQTYLPETYVECDESLAETAQQLIDKLEDLDDVQAVYTNLK